MRQGQEVVTKKRLWPSVAGSAIPAGTRGRIVGEKWEIGRGQVYIIEWPDGRRSNLPASDIR